MNNNLINNIEKAFYKKFSNKKFEIFRILDGGKCYLVAAKSAGTKDPDALDPWYIVDKETAAIKGFQPFMNPKLFNNALKHKLK